MRRFHDIILFASIALFLSFAAVTADDKPEPYPGPAAPKLVTGPDTDGVFNARTYGAKGDAVADDTAAIQATIDAALGDGDPKTTVRVVLGPIYLPPGVYRVSKPLRVESGQFVTFRGAGGSSRLAPVGDLAAVLDINGVAYSTFRDFVIEGRGEAHNVDDVICYRWDPKTAARSSTRNSFERVGILGVQCVTGLRIGKDRNGTQVDQTTYRDLNISGRWTPGEAKLWQHALYVGDGLYANNLCHWGYGLVVDHWSRGIHVEASNFGLWGGGFGANGTDLHANNLAFFNVQGLRSESSGRLFESTGPSSNPATYTLSDVIWMPDAVAPDLEFIRMKAGGTLAVSNLQVPGTAKVKIASGPTPGQTLRLSGIVTPNTLEGFLAGAPKTTACLVSGYYQTAGGGQISATPGMMSSMPIAAPSASMRFPDGSKLETSPDGRLVWTSRKGKPVVLARP